MTGAAWALTTGSIVLVVVLAVVVYDSRTVRRRFRQLEGRFVAMDLDLAAARERIAELQTYLADHASWDASSPRPVPTDVADPATRDRWSPRKPTPDDVADDVAQQAPGERPLRN